MSNPSGYKNRGVRQYTPEQKAAYYARLAQSAYKPKYQTASGRDTKSPASGKGAYRLMPQRISASGKGYYSLKKSPTNRSTAKGKGAYSISNFGGMLGSAIGTAVAPGIGTDIGGALGQLGGSLIDRITGKGAYQIHKNTVLEEGYAQPSFGEESIRVRHTEFVENLDSTTTFTNRTYPINPGIESVFPWLSSIARNYEQYRINGMIIQYKSTTSDAIASSTALGFGQVILATNYDASASAFESQEQMLNYMFSNSGKPSIDILHAIECQPTDTPYKLHYVRTGAIPSNADAKLYDHGIFQLATTGMQAAYAGMGQLFISYDISFFKPVQNNTLGFSVLEDHWKLSGSLNASNTLGSTSTLYSGSNLGTTIAQDGSGNHNTLVFPEDVQDGTYLLLWEINGSSAALSSPVFTYTNCSVVDAWENQAIPDIDNGGSTSDTFICGQIIKLTGSSTVGDQSKVKFTMTTVPGSAVAGDLLIVQLNGTIYDTFTVESIARRRSMKVQEITNDNEECLPDDLTEEERAVIKNLRTKQNKAQEPGKVQTTPKADKK